MIDFLNDFFCAFTAWRKKARKKFRSKLKKFLRACYKLGWKTCAFAAGAVVLVIVGIVIAVTVPKKKQAEAAAALAQQLASAVTPMPTASPTPVPTPTPVPEEMTWVQKGAEGDDVLELQTRLMELGYLEIDEPTSYYGNVTQYAVKLFQRQHDLQQDGIVGTQTRELMFSEEAKPYVMREGDEGDDILSFQYQLEELGYLTVHQMTGYYGSDTVEAVKKFQNRNHLTKDGKAGEQTLEAVNSPDARVSYTKQLEIEKEKKKAAAAAKATSSSGRISKLLSIAKQQVGKPYVLGKSGPGSFDCSGLVYYCLRQVNVYTRRLNAAGFSRTTSWAKITSMGALQKGDLIFFRSVDSSSCGDVAIYAGGGMMYDASSANGKVMYRSCTGSWSKRNFLFARRPIQ